MKRGCGTRRTRSQDWKAWDSGALPWQDGSIVEGKAICHSVAKGCCEPSWERSYWLRLSHSGVWQPWTLIGSLDSTYTSTEDLAMGSRFRRVGDQEFRQEETRPRQWRVMMALACEARSWVFHLSKCNCGISAVSLRPAGGPYSGASSYLLWDSLLVGLRPLKISQSSWLPVASFLQLGVQCSRVGVKA